MQNIILDCNRAWEEKNKFLSIAHSINSSNFQTLREHFYKIENSFNEQFLRLVSITRNYGDNAILTISSDSCFGSFFWVIQREDKTVLHGGLILHGGHKIELSNDELEKQILEVENNGQLFAKYSIHT